MNANQISGGLSAGNLVWIPDSRRMQIEMQISRLMHQNGPDSAKFNDLVSSGFEFLQRNALGKRRI